MFVKRIHVAQLLLIFLLLSVTTSVALAYEVEYDKKNITVFGENFIRGVEECDNMSLTYQATSTTNNEPDDISYELWIGTSNNNYDGVVSGQWLEFEFLGSKRVAYLRAGFTTLDIDEMVSFTNPIEDGTYYIYAFFYNSGTGKINRFVKIGTLESTCNSADAQDNSGTAGTGSSPSSSTSGDTAGTEPAPAASGCGSSQFEATEMPVNLIFFSFLVIPALILMNRRRGE